MDKHHFNLLLIFCLVLALAGILIAVNFYVGRPKVGGSKPIPQSFADINPGPQTTTILAPNGKMTLIVKESKSQGKITDTFSAIALDAASPTEIYSETLSEGTKITVPYNTFSPDNKYVFLKKTSSAGDSYIVVKTDGNTFKNEEKAIDFLSLFKSKYTDGHTVTDVTGWGGMNLIVVNTDKSDGTVSHSFWYDVTSNSFIQLSTRFN